MSDLHVRGKPITTTEVHVSLRFPARVKINDEPRQVISFDGTVSDDYYQDDHPVIAQLRVQASRDSLPIGVFHAVRLYRSDGAASVAMRIDLLIPLDNIASIAPQPFPKSAR